MEGLAWDCQCEKGSFLTTPCHISLSCGDVLHVNVIVTFDAIKFIYMYMYLTNTHIKQSLLSACTLPCDVLTCIGSLCLLERGLLQLKLEESFPEPRLSEGTTGDGKIKMVGDICTSDVIVNSTKWQ